MNFDDFIKRETNPYENKDLSAWREQRIEEWQNNLQKLYDDVESILKKYIDEEKVKIETNDIELTEDFFGTYTVSEMTIHLGDFGKYVKLIPIGTNIIGAYGRVDMKGRNGTIRLVLVDETLESPKINVTIRLEGYNNTDKTTHVNTKPNLAWRFATTPPNIRYIPIAYEIFLEQLMRLS